MAFGWLVFEAAEVWRHWFGAAQDGQLVGGFGGHNLVFLEVCSRRQLCRRFGCRLLVGIARKGVSIDSVLSHLDQSDNDNVELKK